MNGQTGGDLTSTAVLALLGRVGPMSRAALARELGMSAATLTQVSKRLLEQGVIEELDGQAPSRGGRRGRLIGLVADAGRALGVKIAADHVAVVDMRLGGQVTGSVTIPFDAMALDAVPAIVEILRPLTKSSGDAPPLLGIGVGVPGNVDRPDSGIVDAAVLNWDHVPLGAMLRAALEVPVLVENDVNALGSGELLYGRGRALDQFLVVTIGRGIGLAIVGGDGVHRGAHGSGGEFGHVPVEVAGPRCACGNEGCLEALIGGDALVRAARAAGVVDESATAADLAELAEAAGDRAETVRDILYRAGEVLGRQLAALTALLDPEEIIVMGEGTRSWSHWEPGVRAAFSRHAPRGARGLSIEVEPWTDTIWAQGAAALVLAASVGAVTGGTDQHRRILSRLGGSPVEGRA